jgi:hypothetical protein
MNAVLLACDTNGQVTTFAFGGTLEDLARGLYLAPGADFIARVTGMPNPILITIGTAPKHATETVIA